MTEFSKERLLQVVCILEHTVALCLAVQGAKDRECDSFQLGGWTWCLIGSGYWIHHMDNYVSLGIECCGASGMTVKFVGVFSSCLKLQWYGIRPNNIGDQSQHCTQLQGPTVDACVVAGAGCWHIHSGEAWVQQQGLG